MKKVAILQSNYIPWKGYFDMIAAVDEFILYDDVQYTRSDWRNRNKIKTPHGLRWLTVPVQMKGRFGQRIQDAQIHGTDWAQVHWASLKQYYGKASFFTEVASWLQPVYCDQTHTHLSKLNRCLIEAVCQYLDIQTQITWSSDYALTAGKTTRLVDLCNQVGACKYISGPAARDYLDLAAFEAAGIEVQWFDYEGFRPYGQLWGGFEHNVSILDLLFNCGPDSRRHLRH